MMKILEGKYKNKTICSVPGRTTRPMTARLRKSIFGMIGDEIQKVRVLDLFCGSGSMGFEAISRGAEEAVFVDKAPAATDAVGTTSRSLGCENSARIIRSDVINAVRTVHGSFELIFVDPPYRGALVQPSVDAISKRVEADREALVPLLSRMAVVFIRHLPAETPEIPDNLYIFRREIRGADIITILRASEAANEGDE